MKIEKEGFVITLIPENKKDEEELEIMATLNMKVHYYPETKRIKIF